MSLQYDPSLTGRDLVVHHAEDGPYALYARGKLVRSVKADNEYLIGEAIAILLGIDDVADDAFLLGKDYASDNAAQTLVEIDSYTRTRAADRDEADRLRSEARGLLARADQLDPSPPTREG